MTKTIFFTLLFTLIFAISASATSANSAPEITSVDPWPDSADHQEEVYVDAEITGSPEDAWLVVHQSGERIGSTTLIDSNKDGYYVSPTAAFKAEGGESYEIIVKAEGGQEPASKTVEIDTECGFEVFENCVY